MRLYFCAPIEAALNILRSKTREDFYRPDPECRCVFDINRDRALSRAFELRERLHQEAVASQKQRYEESLERQRKLFGSATEHSLPPIAKEEMALVVIDLTDELDKQVLPLAQEDGTTVLVVRYFFEQLSSCIFSLEIVPQTENKLALYGNRAPECGAGSGPYLA